MYYNVWIIERERRTPQLSEGISLDDLRFVHPQIYALDMVTKGWEVFLKRDVDGNGAKVSYSLSRQVSKDFDIEGLVKKIGVLDEEGNIIDEYSVGFTTSVDKKPTLSFNFTGFPTQKTMDVLQNLEKEFLPEDFRPMHLKLIASSDDIEETPQRKSYLDRAKEIFHR